jgi:hypothetical protein
MKYYIPNRMHTLEIQLKPFFPDGCKQVIPGFTSKKAMRKYYGNDVTYRIVKLQEKEQK